MDQYNLDAIFKLLDAKGLWPLGRQEVFEVLASYDYDLTDGFTFGQTINPSPPETAA